MLFYKLVSDSLSQPFFPWRAVHVCMRAHGVRTQAMGLLSFHLTKLCSATP